MESNQCELKININPDGSKTITYPDCLTTLLYNGSECHSNMPLCYENIPDPSGKPSSYWRTRDNVSIKVFKRTQIRHIDENYDVTRDQVLTELILPPKTLVHGIDPINAEKYTNKIFNDKYRAEQAYVYKQTHYSSTSFFLERSPKHKRILCNETVTQSVSMWDKSFIYNTGSLVTPQTEFHYVNKPRKTTHNIPKVYTCESGIHFYHEEIKAKE